MSIREIPYVFEGNGDEKLIVIISHGFGSSKKSTTAVSVAEKLNSMGIGAVRYDFPAHGESAVDGDEFRMKNCVDDLERIENMVAEKYPDAEIAYFSSSFGAFTNLIYLSTRKHRGTKSFLRCSAVDMPGIVRDWLSEEDMKEMKENGYLIIDEDYDRPLKVTMGFYEDLQEINLFELAGEEGEGFPSGGTELRMIHGTADDTAPYPDAVKFAEMYGIKLISVEGSDHGFTPDGAMDIVRAKAAEFFLEG